MEGRQTINLDNEAVSVEWLSNFLNLPNINNDTSRAIPCVIIAKDDKKLGLLVDDLPDEQEIVLKPHSFVLKRVRNISGSAILGTGDICTVLNPHDLIKSLKVAPTVSKKLEKEEKEAEFIKEVSENWKEIVEDFDRILNSMRINYKNESKKNDKSYLC